MVLLVKVGAILTARLDNGATAGVEHFRFLAIWLCWSPTDPIFYKREDSSCSLITKEAG